MVSQATYQELAQLRAKVSQLRAERGIPVETPSGVREPEFHLERDSKNGMSITPNPNFVPEQKFDDGVETRVVFNKKDREVMMAGD